MDEEIISDFFQGTVIIREETKKCLKDYKNGNCVAIALIKAALVQFESIENIFSLYKEFDNQIKVTFKDSFEVSVNREEIDIVKKISGIEDKSNSVYYQTGIKLYAIICKRIYLSKEMYSTKCINSFLDAVEYLNSGYPTKKAYHLLALDRKRISPKKITSFKSVIIYSGAHASYCNYGYQDIMGTKNKIKNILGVRWMKNPRGIGGKVKGAYILKHKN